MFYTFLGKSIFEINAIILSVLLRISGKYNLIHQLSDQSSARLSVLFIRFRYARAS